MCNQCVELQKTIDALRAENEDIKTINEVLSVHTAKLESKLHSRIEKLREALTNLTDDISIQSNGCDCPEIARKALSEDDEDHK